MLWCKGTKNKANHNSSYYFFLYLTVGCYGAKVLKIKQITTESRFHEKRECWMLWCKGTKNKANHNQGDHRRNSELVGCYGAKVLKIKQITTR